MQHAANVLVNGVRLCAECFGLRIPFMASAEITFGHADRAQQCAGPKVSWAKPVASQPGALPVIGDCD